MLSLAPLLLLQSLCLVLLAFDACSILSTPFLPLCSLLLRLLFSQASGWWPLGFVTAAAAAAAEAVRSTGAGALGGASEPESPDAASPVGEAADAPAADDAAAGDTRSREGRVRFHPNAMTGGQGRSRRWAGRSDTVANMGFVELVENLLLTHDAAQKPMSRSSTVGSAFTEISEQDSDVDSVIERAREQVRRCLSLAVGGGLFI